MSRTNPCSGCGAPNPTGKRSCYDCGAELVAAAPAPVSERIRNGTATLRSRWLLAAAVGVVVGAGFLLPGRFGPVNLERAALHGRNFAGANLRHANLRTANLTEADLSRTDLTGAYLTGSQLARARLPGANLTGARLEGVNLSGADLSGANLANANFSDAQLDDANLERANLTGAILERASFNRGTRWPSGFNPAAHGAGTVE